MKKRIGIQGTIGITSGIAALLLHRYVFPSWRGEFWEEFTDVFGVLLIFMGFLFRVSARGHKADNTNGGNILVVDGPYAMTRNPMYTGTLLMTSGIIITLFQWWILILLGVALLSIYWPQIIKEEAVLRRRFGGTYEQYCRNTGRFFPKWTVLTGIFKHLAIRIVWLKRELFSISLITGIVISVEIWQDICLFGRNEFLSEFFEILIIVLLFVSIVFAFRKK